MQVYEFPANSILGNWASGIRGSGIPDSRALGNRYARGMPRARVGGIMLLGKRQGIGEVEDDEDAESNAGRTSLRAQMAFERVAPALGWIGLGALTAGAAA